MKVALILGSISQKSMTHKIAQFMVEQFPENIQYDVVQIQDLPLYTQDLDSITVPAYERVREQLKTADAVLIVTPEHNRSVPAALKNLLDIGSRPSGQNVWAGKKVAVATASPGSYGGINSGLHIRQILQALGSNVLSAEVYLSQAHTALSEEGKVINERTAGFLGKFAANFVTFIK